MEARGLVERTACETDGRGTWIGITAEGRRLLLRAMRDHADAIRELFFDRLTDDEKASIRAASIRMLGARPDPRGDRAPHSRARIAHEPAR